MLPKSIEVLGYEYQIVLSSTMPGGVPGDSFGACDFSEGKIYVAEGLNKRLASSTLLHEVLEALNYHLELGLKHSQISALEAGLYQVLRTNGNRDGTINYFCSSDES